jgi:hypothetical protein
VFAESRLQLRDRSGGRRPFSGAFRHVIRMVKSIESVKSCCRPFHARADPCSCGGLASAPDPADYAL